MKFSSAKFGVILIGLIIFCYVGVCNAQCAWILWVHVTAISFSEDKSAGIVPEPPKTINDNWVIIGATPKFEQCLQIQRNAFEESKKKHVSKKEYEKPFESISYEFWDPKTDKKGGLITEVFKCLPDTIDPRK